MTTRPRNENTSELILLGINHNTAPIEVRERLAIPAGRLGDATRSLLAAPGIREGLILSTCNRVELLTLQGQGSGDSHATLLRFLEEYFSVPAASIRPHLYEFREREAVRHLFRVASSLDSMVVGEPQILGQVKESYTVAKEVGGVSSSFEKLLQSAFTTAKKVRSETQIGSSSVSIASVAVDLARKIFGSLAGKQVLLVGAGKMSELALRHLIQHGARHLLLSNRTLARAEAMAARLHAPGVTTEILPFDDLFAQTPRADIVITSTGSSGQLFGRANGQQFLQRRRGRPMFFIDIAVPRDVDPAMNEVDGCFVYDIDDLQQVAQTNQQDRNREAQSAERIVNAEVARYQQRVQSLDAVPAIRQLQAYAEGLRLNELARAEAKLADLTPEQKAAVQALTRSLTNKFLHHPLTAIRAAAERGDTEAMERLATLYGQPRD
jgi:glutamyl-tRNA reductase